MSKLVLITDSAEQRNNVLNRFHNELGSLMRIRGFQFKKYYDGFGNLVALDWFSFSRKQNLFTLQFNRADLPVALQIKPHLEQILTDLSIFQLVDIFIFDELGLVEPYVEQIRQQIITVFSSLHSVIATVNQDHLQDIDYLQKFESIEYKHLKEYENERMYLNLIGELYDS